MFANYVDSHLCGRRVEALQVVDRAKLDDWRKARLLVLEVQARIASANQKSWETPEREL